MLVLTQHALQRWDERIGHGDPETALSDAVDVTCLRPYLPFSRGHFVRSTLLWNRHHRALFLVRDGHVITVYDVHRRGHLALLRRVA